MSLAIDFGARVFRGLRVERSELRGQRVRATMLVVPDSAISREVLDRAGLGYGVSEGGLVLMGSAAVEMARMFGAPSRDVLRDGRAPARDPIARQVAGLLADGVLGTPAHEGEVCAYVCHEPGPGGIDRQGDDFFGRLVRLRGYRPVRVSAGLALVHAELATEQFTGLALDFGASGTEFSLAVCGREVLSGRLAGGGRGLDEEYAHEFGLQVWDSQGGTQSDLDGAAARREALSENLASPATAEGEAWGRLYRNMLARQSRELATALEAAELSDGWRRPLAMVYAGGLTHVPGFEALLQTALGEVRLPIDIQRVFAADPSPYCVARGALILAELEQPALRGAA